MKIRMNTMRINLLVEVRTLDNPAIAVLQDVDMADRPKLTGLLLDAITEHYCDPDSVSICRADIPEDGDIFAGIGVPFEISQDGEDWEGLATLTMIPIYNEPLYTPED